MMHKRDHAHKIAKRLLSDGVPSEAVGQLLGISGRIVRKWFPDRPSVPRSPAEAKPAPEALSIPAGAARHPPSAPHGHVRRREAHGKRFVITSAQNATPVHKPFLDALKVLCAHVEAELIVVPYRYRNPTSLFSEEQQDDEWWHADVAPFLVAERMELNRNLLLCADIKIVPTAAKPLTSLQAETGKQSAIFGHPRRALRTVATPQASYPKQLFTTGSCTLKNYSDTKTGKMGFTSHTTGAVIVEIDGDTFHHRQLTAAADGSFYDLENHYTADGVRPTGRVAGLVMGDIHVDVVDPEVVYATFGPGSITEALRPRELVLHDVIDCHSISHHHEKNPLLKIEKHFQNTNDIEAEVHRCFEFVDRYAPEDTLIVFPASNHNEHLERWVGDNAKKPAADPTNVQFWAKLFSEGVRCARLGQKFEPLAWLASEYLQCYSETKWLERDEHHAIAGNGVEHHGDLGSNGSRGSLEGLARLALKIVIAHGHGAGIEGLCVQVGTSTRKRIGYNKGPSNWLHAHYIIYEDGNGTLVNVINGEWRLP